MDPPADAAFAISNHALRHGGGIERYALTIVRALHARGVQPAFIAKRFDTALPEYGWVRPLRAGVDLVPGKWRDFAFDWRIGRIKRRLGLFPLVGCNQTRWSDIAICGSTHPGFLAAMGRTPGWLDRRKIALERAHFENARIVIAHSAKMRDELVRHHGIDAAKVELLYPPVDTARFTPVDAATRTALRARLGLPADRAVFLLASTGHARKGLDLLADYFASTTLPVTLVVAGRPLDGRWPNVRALGYRADLENVYRAVDCTVIASHYEPFGLVGVESVLCGTPVLLAQGVGCAEVIRAPAAIGFDPAQPGALAAAVDAALARWHAGTARIADPQAHLGYDPSADTHVGQLMRRVAALVSARPDGRTA